MSKRESEIEATNHANEESYSSIKRIRTKTEPTETRLDMLPLEILEKVTSWLDWPSRLRLKDVSAHCWDAVGLLFGRLLAVKVVFGRDIMVQFQGTDGNVLNPHDHKRPLTDLAGPIELMSQLGSVRELHIIDPLSRSLRGL